MPALAPAPSLWSFVRMLWKHRGAQPFERFAAFARAYGPVVRIGRGRWQVLLVSDPDLIRQVLVVEAEGYIKDSPTHAMEIALGKGLLTSEGDFHKRQRRLIQPAFHRARLPHYGEIMAAAGERCSRSWKDGDLIDLSQRMMGLTLDVVASALFGADIGSQVDEIGESLDFCLSQFTPPRILLMPLLHRLPLASTLGFRKHSARLRGIIDAIISERRRSPGASEDLLSMLLHEEMSDEQLRDECLTLFLAGHETTALALTWTFYLLDRHPEIAARVHAEIDALPGPVCFADLPRLVFTEKVIRESMRLYPPSWTLGREALRDTRLAGYAVPRKSTVVISQWLMHHHSDYFPEPERFWPDRWTAEFAAQLPRFAYFPFGGGPRICVAESFARTETLLLLATLARDWVFRCDPQHTVTPQAYITVRPRGGLPGRVWRRG